LKFPRPLRIHLWGEASPVQQPWGPLDSGVSRLAKHERS
jgi:hypothetical protein